MVLCHFALMAACGGPAEAPAVEEQGPAAVPPRGVEPPSSSSSSGTEKGVLLFATDTPLVGIAFESGPAKGETDATGAFSYVPGTPVHFRIGGETVTVKGAPLLTPYQLAGAASCADTPELKRLVALLQPGVADPFAAFVRAFDGESWVETGKDTFSGGAALVRGQGVATDGSSWFFSGATGLEKTDASFASAKSNALAIPFDLLATGSNHIGDIDFWNGKIYAPVEDKNYQAPKVVLFDPSSLASETVHAIPQSLQTKGVPWIAVDGPRGVAYMAEWDPTPAINVFSLATMTYSATIPLSRAIGRVQGGKLHEGSLYLSTDEAQKHVYKVHLASGTLIDLFALDVTNVEMEGLAFLARPDGTLLHTLNVTESRTGVDMRHHRLARAPLRWKACP